MNATIIHTFSIYLQSEMILRKKQGPNMILFYSDYLEGCHPEILKQLQETNFDQTPGYGVDRYCDEAREIIRKVCNVPEADVHFLVGGTQTNVTVMSAILRPHQGAVCATTGHINTHETGAIEHSGHKTLPIQTADGKVTAMQVDELIHSHYNDPSREHMVQPGLLYISFPTELGTIYTRQELIDIKSVCDKWSIPLFIDGARLGYGLTSAACDVTLHDIAAIADVFYIGGTKQGALFGEAVVINRDSLKKDFRYYIKQNGGMLAKGRLLGIQFSTLFSDKLYFKIAENANRLARRLTDALREKGYKFYAESPTNQVFPILTIDKAETLSHDFGFENWGNTDDTHIATRFCTSWATTDEQIDALIKAL